MISLLFFAAGLLLASPTKAAAVREPADCNPPCDNPIDISFVIDASNSIYSQNFTQGIKFIQAFVNEFTIGPNDVRVSAVTFGHRTYSEDAFDFDAYTDKWGLEDAIAAIEYRGGTSTETGDAINWMLENQRPKAREEARKVAIVLTDGNSQDKEKTKQAAQRAKDEGLEVIAIGVGVDITYEELHNIASDSNHVFRVDSYNLLINLVEGLKFEVCNPPTPLDPPCKFQPIDIALVIDSSVSIGAENFTTGMSFLKEFLTDFLINPSSTRVASVMYGDRIYSEFDIPFHAAGTKNDLVAELNQLTWQHGTRTETGMGIDYMVDNYAQDIRPYAVHLAVVLTDGESQEPDKTARAAERARNAGFTILAIGVGEYGTSLSQHELESIAGDDGFVIVVGNYNALFSIKDELVTEICDVTVRRLSNSDF